MPKQWYVKIGEKLYGPYSSAQLKQLADTQKLRPNNLVSLDADGPWYPASAVRGLFAESVLQQTTAQSPQQQSAPSLSGASNIFSSSPVSGTPPVQPEHPASSASAAMAIAQLKAAKKRQQRRRILLFSIGLAAVAIVAVVTIALVRPQPSKRSVKASSSDPYHIAELAKSEETEPIESVSDLLGSDDVGKPNSENEQEAVPLDKLEYALKDPVTLQLAAARLTKPIVVVGGRRAWPRDPKLVLEVDVKNVSGRKIEYAGFGQVYSAQLVDADGRVYHSWQYPGAKIEHQVNKLTLEPNQTIKDVIVFPAPDRRQGVARVKLVCRADQREVSQELRLDLGAVEVEEIEDTASPAPVHQPPPDKAQSPGQPSVVTKPRIIDDGGPIPIPGLQDNGNDADASPDKPGLEEKQIEQEATQAEPSASHSMREATNRKRQKRDKARAKKK